MDVVESVDERDRQEFWYEYHWWQVWWNPDFNRQAG
jgi:hypothetical protein